MDLSEARLAITRHPWEVARARFFVDTIARLRPMRVLDVGSGDAYLVQQLLDRVPAARAVAWDTSYGNDDLRGLCCDRLVATRTRPEGPFDAALLLDVLEHVEDDAGLVGDVCRLVKPGGVVVASVPAWPALHSAHDMQLRHLRRYTPARALALLADAGLRIETSGGLFHSLLAPRAFEVGVVQRLGRARLGGPAGVGVGAWSAGPFVTAVIGGALRLDTALSRALAAMHVSAPGLSFWALARR